MNVEIIAVGRLRESFYRDAAAEYTKRLSRYAQVKIIEIEDEKKPDVIPDLLAEKIRNREGERILKAYRPRAYHCILDLRGKPLSSESLARKIDEIYGSGYDTIQFVIGGAIGLSEDVVKSADFVLNCSQLTFPHQLMRVILLEQIYRSFRIIRGEPYHK